MQKPGKKGDIASEPWEIKPKRETKGAFRMVVTGDPGVVAMQQRDTWAQRASSRKNWMEFAMALNIFARDLDG